MTRPPTTNFSTSRMLLTLASLVIVIAGIKAADTLLVPFLLALLIAIIASPALFSLQRAGFPTALALIIVIVGITAVGFVLFTIISSSVQGFTAALPDYEQRLTLITTNAIEWVNSFGFNIASDELLKYLDPSQAIKLVGNMLNAFSSVLTNSFLIILTAIFMLLEASSLPAKLRSVLKDPDSTLFHLEAVASSVKHYLGIKTLASLATGVFIAVWLAIIGVDFPVLWGLIAFLLNFVPNIGSILAAVPALLLALVQLGIGHTLWAALGYLIANMLIGNVIEPRFMGRSLGLSTLVVFVSLVFWGWVLGPVGMFLSVPLTMAVKIALESEPGTLWIAVMLGQGPLDAKNLAVNPNTDEEEKKPIS